MYSQMLASEFAWLYCVDPPPPPSSTHSSTPLSMKTLKNVKNKNSNILKCEKVHRR